MRMRSFFLFTAAAWLASSTISYAAEQLIANNMQRQLSGNQEMRLLDELNLGRRNARLNSLIVVASTMVGQGDLSVELNGQIISNQRVGTNLEAIQVQLGGRDLNRDIRSLRILTRGNFTVAMTGITLDDAFGGGGERDRDRDRGGHDRPPYGPGPGPAPAPRPGPMPPIPAPPSYMVLGNMENVAFNFRVSNLQDLFQQCSVYFKNNRLSAVDDIQVSVNSEPMQALRNSSGYWKTATETCVQVASYARARGVIDANRGGITIYAAIEGVYEMALQGYDRNSVVQQCMQQYSSLGINGMAVDDVAVSVNMSELRQVRNSSGYWRDAASLCLAIGNTM